MDKETILREIQRIAKENDGVPPGKKMFERESGIKEHEWSPYLWVRWSDAQQEAGFEPTKMNQPYEEGFLLEKFVLLMREIGRFPRQADLKIKHHSDKEFPSDTAFRRKLGKKSEKAEKLVAYSQERDGYDDVIKWALPFCDNDEAVSHVSDVFDDKKAGYVYLMKSGRSYKIGKSNAVGRREYELGTKLPEKPNTLHKIKTDDPDGIEHYWHQRFSDKRKRGEWFELTTADVRAFKRWKRIF